MAAKLTWDFTNKLIILDQVAPDGNGFVEIDVQVDLYSDWKEDFQGSPSYNRGVLIPWRATGGDELTPTKNIGGFYFLQNGWKIRPYEADHVLILSGNLYVEPSTAQVFEPTVGDYTVSAIIQRAVDAITVTGTDANIVQIDGSTTAAENLRRGAESIVWGSAVTGTLTTTEMTTDLTETTDNHYKGRTIIWTTGTLKQQQAVITGYVGSNKKLQYEATTEAPLNNDEFIIV